MIKIFFPVLLLVHILILSRMTFTAWPEMLSYPYLFLNGFIFYKDFIMPYPPLLPLVLSGIYSLFGVTPEVLKITTWVLILSTDVLLFLIIRKVLKSGILALPFLAIYILLQSFFDGNMLWFDFAIVLPLLASFYFALKKNLFWAGVFIGLAVLVKQTAGVYLPGFLLGLVLIRVGKRDLAAFAGGLFITGLFLAAYLVATGGFLNFWNWVIVYPLTEWSKFPGYVDFAVPKKYILALILLLSPLSFIVLNFKILKEKLFLVSLVFLVASLIAVYPRFSFFHLQPAVAFAVIAFAVLSAHLPKKLKIIQMFLILFSVAFILKIIYPVNFGEPYRFYGEKERRLSGEISDLGEQKILLLGVDSSLYVFSKTLPPKNWSDNYGWYLEIPGVQDWVLEGIRTDNPSKIIWREAVFGPWYKPGVYQPEKIVNYLKTHYDKEREIESGINIWTKRN